MKEFRKDLLTRLGHFPTTIMGFIILLIGLGLVGLGKMDMLSFTAFAGVALPFFFLKKGGDKPSA